MKYVSTRGAAPAADFSTAALTGLAPDGGLYVPQAFPRPETDALAALDRFALVAERVLRPFLEGDALSADLPDACAGAFDFPVPLEPLDEGTALLELFHGPTAAFKDFGARFLAECMERSPAARSRDGRPLTILVATSGDTGGAVAAAFYRRAGVRVIVLYPDGGVSARQEQQLTCWGDNVRSLAVRGTFDDCQRLVKSAFLDPRLSRAHRLTSANSINIGRLLPQVAYYAAASLWYRGTRGVAPGFVVPTGNVGNAVGAFWAARLGFPVREIVMATNANRVIPDWFETSRWSPRPSVPTLANAMDVGNPSNMERLFALYPEREALRATARAMSVDDATIRRTIAEGPRTWGRVWCPHTATAVHVRQRLATPHWVVVATAHPAKFETIVEPLVGSTIDPPPRLAELLDRPRHVTRIEPDLERLGEVLDD